MRIGFALEYTLGHTTHALNLKHALRNDDTVEPVFIDLPYHDTPGVWAKLPGVRSNWSLRASIGARLGLEPHRGTLDAAYFHTQVTSLLSTPFMRDVPSVISLDATPIQYDALGEYYGHVPSTNARVEAVKKRVNERAFEAASHLVTFSDWAKRSLVDDYGIPADKVTTISSGIDIVRWNFPERTAGDEINLLFVGGDFERKGGRILLEAFRQLPAGRVRLNIVSNSAEAPDGVRNVLVHRDVKQNSDMLLALFAAADIFVFPTMGDCLPFAVMEAMAAGLPVIATDVGAITEAVVDGETGIVVPMGNPEALATAIVELIDDPAKRLRMGKLGREIVEKRYNAAVNYARLIALLKDQVKAGS